MSTSKPVNHDVRDERLVDRELSRPVTQKEFNGLSPSVEESVSLPFDDPAPLVDDPQNAFIRVINLRPFRALALLPLLSMSGV